MIVVDLGCHPQGREESVYRLADRFRPGLLYGLDPHPDLVEGVEVYAHQPSDGSTITVTTILRRRAAAWVDSSPVPYREDGIVSGVEPDARRLPAVPAVDVADLLNALPRPLVLKLDCEGCEYPILRRLRQTAADERLDLVLVEWHTPDLSHGLHGRRPKLRCPIEEW